MLLVPQENIRAPKMIPALHAILDRSNLIVVATRRVCVVHLDFIHPKLDRRAVVTVSRVLLLLSLDQRNAQRVAVVVVVAAAWTTTRD